MLSPACTVDGFAGQKKYDDDDGEAEANPARQRMKVPRWRHQQLSQIRPASSRDTPRRNNVPPAEVDVDAVEAFGGKHDRPENKLLRTLDIYRQGSICIPDR